MTDRPFGIAVLAILNFLFGAVLLAAVAMAPFFVSALSSLSVPSLPYASYPQIQGYPMLPSLPSTLQSGFGALQGIVMGVVAIMAAISFVLGYGLWKGKAWSWWVEALGAVLSMLTVFVLNIIGAVVGAVVLYYLTRKEIKAYFGV
jgi:hypothetical protein